MMMDWMNGNLNPPLVPRQENSLSFLYNCNYNNYDHFPGVEMKYPMVEKNIGAYPRMSEVDKKKRLTNEQLDSLENSFMEDQKLEPERKTKLARELGLQPRQIAVWFQNRRARWKAKELERSYDALRLEYDSVFKEKKRLQEEVLKLKMMLKERASHHVSTGHTEISGEGTMESTSKENPSPTKWPVVETSCNPNNHNVDRPMFNVLNDDDYINPLTPIPSYWNTTLPSYP